MLHDNLSVNERGHLTFAGLDTVLLAKRYGTPVYVMDEARIRANMQRYIAAMRRYFGGGSRPLFASKSLSFKRVYEIAHEEGMGIDVVSAGELYTAHMAGFPLEWAFFHGNNKTPEEISLALDLGMGYFVVDNAYELMEISNQAAARGVTQKILLRITPGIDPHTHAKISTGNVDSKFGSPIVTGQAEEIVALALQTQNVELCGYHCHIGSQIFDIDPFCDAADIMLEFSASVRDKFGFEARIVNLGGGFGVRYTEDDPVIDIEKNIEEISRHIDDSCKKLDLTRPDIIMEPGRSIVADAGITLYTSGGVKTIPGFRSYVSIDGGMPDNPRYALYQSVYTVVNASHADRECDLVATLAGKCCESGDMIGEGMKIATPDRGDIVATLVTGAYNYAMSSNYNRICRPPVVMISPEGKDYVAVARETLADLLRNDM